MEKLKSFLFENQTTKQTFLKNSFWLAAGNVVSRAMRAALIIVAARILQTEGYGIYSYALSLAGFFTIFSDIGLSSLLTRELSKHKNEDIAPYIATTFYIKIAFIVFSVAVTALLGPSFTKIAEVKVIIPIVALLTAFDSMRGFFYSITRSANQMEVEARSTILTEIFIDALTLTALFLRPTITNVTIAYTVGAALGCIAIGWRTRHIWLPAMKRHFEKRLVKRIVNSAWPFAVMGLLGSFMINIDSLVIGWFRSANELGLYAAAQKPIQLLYIIPSLLSTGLFPLVSKMAHDGKKESVARVTNQLFRGVILLGLPITLGGIILGGKLINLAFGAAYLGGALTFQLLLLTLPTVFAGTIWGNVVFAYDKQKIFVVTTLIGAVLNTGLDFLLIPTYGLPGSAVATIISQIFSNGYTWLRLRAVVDVSLFKGLGKIFLSTVSMGALVYAMQAAGFGTATILAAGTVFYPVFLFLLREPVLKSIPLIERFVK